MFKLKAQQKEIKLELIYDRALPQQVNTDENRFKQVIINLLSNAIKYTQNGYVRLYGEISLKRRTLNFVIEDTGVGMTKQQISNLFINFTKIMDNRQLNKEGVGLGLTISRNIAQALGGDIKVKSIIGKGSTFIFSIPLGQFKNSNITTMDDKLAKEYSQVLMDSSRQDSMESHISQNKGP